MKKSFIHGTSIKYLHITRVAALREQLNQPGFLILFKWMEIFLETRQQSVEVLFDLVVGPVISLISKAPHQVIKSYVDTFFAPIHVATFHFELQEVQWVFREHVHW